jgi:hypothetical protein
LPAASALESRSEALQGSVVAGGAIRSIRGKSDREGARRRPPTWCPFGLLMAMAELVRPWGQTYGAASLGQVRLLALAASQTAHLQVEGRALHLPTGQEHTRSCSTRDYRVMTDLGQPFMTRLIDLVEFTLRPNRRACLLRHVRITFAVQGQSGGSWAALSQIQGNPANRVIGAMLSPDMGVGVFWAWSNWCGGGDRFRAYAQVGGRPVAGRTWAKGATCEDARAPSTLMPSYGHL